jgi:curved DNA-binding protein CbpA
MLKSNNPDSTERRNYYRTLNVQPDASLEIIKNNYRTLLQKLRLHPDLGGKNWNASIINEAYNTLRNPTKRAAYDKELLKCYDLKVLSRGNLDGESIFSENKLISDKDKHGNKRNFYRMFNIQPDSPKHIIKTSYLTLSKDPSIPKNLLNEAYTILSNTEKRALYDKLLSQRSHAYALSKLTNNPDKVSPKIKSKTVTTVTKLNKPYFSSKHQVSNSSYYQPVITQYCSFCKTPHDQSPCEHTAALCNECHSPLFPPSDAFLEQQRREIIRMVKDQKIEFYDYWPGKKLYGSISDISPTGLQLVSSKTLAKDQVIKLDGKDFKAVGIVSYIKHETNRGLEKIQTSGIKFTTVNFNRRKGHFFSESA